MTSTSGSVEASVTVDLPRPTTVIERTRGWNLGRLREVWEFRELLYFLAWRDVKIRYKQAVLGSAWAILQPFLFMVVFSVFLGRFVGVPSNGVPYPIFSYAALVPWVLFSSSLGAAANSVVSNANLLSRVYFPRVILTLASTGSFLLDFVIALGMLGLLMAYYGIAPTINILWLPALTVLALLAASATGILLAAVNVRYRDVRYAVPFLIQIWLFATPVAYPSTIVPEGWRLLFGLNPMAGVVEGFRWALLGTHTRPGPLILASAGATLLLLVVGLAYFQRTERQFADVI